MKESRGCLPAGSEGEDAVFVYLCLLDYVAGLGTNDDVTSVCNCTMKIYALRNFGLPVALHLQIFKEAMFTFNLQLRRKGEDLSFCSSRHRHGERFRRVRVWRCILLQGTHKGKVNV